MGALNRHSRAFGNDALSASGRVLRGQRVYCSNRGKRGGCGRTFLISLAQVLPRYTMPAQLLWQWLLCLLEGASLKAAAESLRLPFVLETFYRAHRKLRRQLDRLRTRLCRQQEPPMSARSNPLHQSLEHLQALFNGSSCPPADFQLRFQQPFFG